MIAGVAAGEELNVALGRTARQISTRDETSPARAALDGNDTTTACTGNRQGHPWWAVDLGQHYIVHHVIITSAAERRNYGHTHTNRPNSSLDWVLWLCLTGPISLCSDTFLCMYYKSYPHHVRILHIHAIYTVIHNINYIVYHCIY